MNSILCALIALLQWRLVLCTLGSIVVVVILSNAFPAFTAVYCLALMIFGVAFGMYWQVRADASVRLAQVVPESDIGAPVAVLGLAFIGLVCGGVLAAMLGSRLLGAAALLLAGLLVALWRRFAQRKPLQLRTVAFAFCALSAGYLPLLLLSAGGAL